MNDREITLSRITTIGFWGLVLCLLLATWTVGLFGDWHVAMLLGITSCLASAGAAVSHIRCYNLSVCSLVRAAATIEPRGSESTSGLSSIR